MQLSLPFYGQGAQARRQPGCGRQSHHSSPDSPDASPVSRLAVQPRPPAFPWAPGRVTAAGRPRRPPLGGAHHRHRESLGLPPCPLRGAVALTQFGLRLPGRPCRSRGRCPGTPAQARPTALGTLWVYREPFLPASCDLPGRGPASGRRAQHFSPTLQRQTEAWGGEASPSVPLQIQRTAPFSNLFSYR